MGHERATAYFKGLLGDTAFYRSTALIDRLKAENDTAIEYYDADKDNDVYEFQETREKNLLTIKLHVLHFVAKALKEENKDLFAAVFG